MSYADFLRYLDMAGVSGGGNQASVDLGLVGTELVLDLSKGYGFRAELTGPATLSIVGGATGDTLQRIALIVNSNGFALAWPSGVEPFKGTPPVLSDKGKDFINLTSLDGALWIGDHVQSGFQPSIIVEDDFLGAAGVAVESRVTPTGEKSWITNVAGAFTFSGDGKLIAAIKANQNQAVFDSGVSDFSLRVIMSSQSDDQNNCCLADLLFRYVDAGNTWGLEIDSRFQRITVHVLSGYTPYDKIVVDYQHATSDAPIEIQIDAYGPVVKLSLDEVEVASVLDPSFQTATKMGVYMGVGGNTSGAAKWTGPLKVTAPKGVKLNWPVWAKQSTTPLIPLTPQGTYGDTDINNPNVFYDTPNKRFALYASVYSNKAGAGSSAGAQFAGADSQVQHTGMFYSDSISGPYVADAANPTMLALPEDGYFAFNGGMVELNGVYYHVYVSDNGSSVRFATSNDLHNWTRHGVIVNTTTPAPVPAWRANAVFDPFLRVRQDGHTLEMWLVGFDGTTKRFGCFTSADLGATWTEETTIAPALPPTNVFLNGSAGEPAVFVPPGQEGKQLLISFDYVQPITQGNPPIARRVGEGIYVFATQTWYWRANAGSPGNFPWESAQNFDSFTCQGPDGKLYRFYSGSNVDGPSLDLNIQLGMSVADWPFDSLVQA